ncbi:MAG: hypothetical protein NTW53_00730 [Burkholderiales bacterium]|nr:hypothetical protein [Burkholderiales bacterium]
MSNNVITIDSRDQRDRLPGVEHATLQAFDCDLLDSHYGRIPDSNPAPVQQRPTVPQIEDGRSRNTACEVAIVKCRETIEMHGIERTHVKRIEPFQQSCASRASVKDRFKTQRASKACHSTRAIGRKKSPVGFLKRRRNLSFRLGKRACNGQLHAPCELADQMMTAHPLAVVGRPWQGRGNVEDTHQASSSE